ncbi:DUF1232 domain-containing protein [Arcobacter acticola]|jgi:uncharacterized membrane protein YkvA (DUF1232 family)|uniref:DUF1232 domain-containing protein n=1 Tax=Arcobacter acticola TaxID=1849015 RepID=A0A6M8EAJ6_9BACT|nr:YkvA family protein [Arcobacter acticola]QKE27430.1 DUF1232 domain-containing protein [Arcobacter acticola]
MEINKEQEALAKKKFEDDIKNVDSDDVDYASKKGKTKIDELDKNPPSVLMKVWNDLKLMINLIIDYVKGDYTNVPWNTIAAITGAIIYFVSPIDVIPDFIPVVGYVDDLTVIKFTLDLVSEDLIKYKQWKNN